MGRSDLMLPYTVVDILSGVLLWGIGGPVLSMLFYIAATGTSSRTPFSYKRILFYGYGTATCIFGILIVYRLMVI